MHILGNTCLNNLIYHISPKMLLVLKVHVFTSRDEKCVGPDQVGSWLIWICCVLKKKDKSRLSMKVVNIHQLLCVTSTVSKFKDTCESLQTKKIKYILIQVMGTLYRYISFTAVLYTP